MVRCKFTCQSVTKKLHWEGKSFVYEAQFSAVSDGSEDDQKYFEATPYGDLKIGTFKDDVFEVGKAYYLDLSLSG